MKKYVYLFLFIIFLSACKDDANRKKHNLHQPKVVEAKGYIVPKDSISEPKVFPIDVSKLKKVPVGNPKIVATNSNVHTVGVPKVIPVGKPKIIIPGTVYTEQGRSDTFALPKTVPAIDSPFFAKQPKPIPALPFRMKDAATCNIQYLDVDQGMNSSKVCSILEDKSGNLWFGTNGGGVSKYDWKSFTHYTEKEGLSNNKVLSMVEDKSGNIWFGTGGGGVSKYDGKSFTHYTEKEGLNNNNVFSILEDNGGNLWFGTYGGGVSKYDGKSFTHYTEKEGLSNNNVFSILEDNSGNLWFGTYGGGVCKYDGKSFTHYTDKEGLSNNSVWSILEDKSGNLWLGTVGGGVSKYDGKSFTHYTENEGLSNNSVFSILEDKTGNLWFGTLGGGVSKYDGISFVHYTEKEGLSNNNVYFILGDESGNLWFGTDGGGVSKYEWKSFTHYADKEGLSNNNVLSILEDKSGNLWFGSYLGGVSKYDGKFFTHYTEKEGLSNNTVFSIIEDKSGNLWFGTGGGGVSKYDGKSFTHYTQMDGLSNNAVLSILEDKSGNLWFGTLGGGVSKYDGKSFTHYTEKEGLSNNTVWSILEDKRGNLWFGTNGGGVSKYDGKSFTHYTDKEGLSSKNVRPIHEDKSGNLWFGTLGGGVSKYDGKSFIHYTDNEGLSSNTVWSILEDKSGNLWLSTEKGLNCFLVSESGLSTSKLRNNRQVVNPKIMEFHKEDGLKAEDFFQNSVLLDSKNRIWWGSGKALSMLNLNEFKLNDKEPEIQLDNIYLQENFVDYRHLNDKLTDSFAVNENNKLKNIQFSGVANFHNYPEELELPYYLNHLTFNFSAIDWYAPHKIKYQYKLEGLDLDWSNLTAENKADYRNMPHGSYTFKVKAIGSANKWSETFEYSFVINPPWYKTNWAFGGYALAFVGAIFGFSSLRTRQLKAKQKELKQKVEEAIIEIRQQKEMVEDQRQLIVEKQKEITDSINYAQKIQEAYMPPIGALEYCFSNSFLLFQPKDIVSGDFYYINNPEDENGNRIDDVYLAAADCTGHGVPGSIMSIICCNALNEAILVKKIRETGKILDEVRSIIMRNLKSDKGSDRKDGMDIALVRINKKTLEMQFSGANNPLWYMSNEGLQEIKGDKQPIGMYENMKPFTTHSLQTANSISFYLFTDGFADQFGGPKGKKYKYTQLKEFLLSISSLSMPEQHLRLKSEFETWKGDLEQVDDVCIIGVRI